MKEDILGYSVDAASSNVCCDNIVSSVDNGDKEWLACINPHSYAVSRKDSKFRDALSSAKWLVPDGVGIILGSRILNGKITQRITGYDIFEGVSTKLNEKKRYTVFFLGSTSETLSKIREKYSLEYPELEVVGIYSPPFKPSYSAAELHEIKQAINDVSPDVLWVGLTAPKQEKFIFENLSDLDVKFVGAIGAVFDFYIGNVKRSHPAFQKLGLEWLPRLIQQPRRLWKRTIISAPIFLFSVFKQKLRIS